MTEHSLTCLLLLASHKLSLGEINAQHQITVAIATVRLCTRSRYLPLEGVVVTGHVTGRVLYIFFACPAQRRRLGVAHSLSFFCPLTGRVGGGLRVSPTPGGGGALPCRQLPRGGGGAVGGACLRLFRWGGGGSLYRTGLSSSPPGPGPLT